MSYKLNCWIVVDLTNELGHFFSFLQGEVTDMLLKSVQYQCKSKENPISTRWIVLERRRFSLRFTQENNDLQWWIIVSDDVIIAAFWLAEVTRVLFVPRCPIIVLLCCVVVPCFFVLRDLSVRRPRVAVQVINILTCYHRNLLVVTSRGAKWKKTNHKKSTQKIYKKKNT